MLITPPLQKALSQNENAMRLRILHLEEAVETQKKLFESERAKAEKAKEELRKLKLKTFEASRKQSSEKGSSECQIVALESRVAWMTKCSS